MLLGISQIINPFKGTLNVSKNSSLCDENNNDVTNMNNTHSENHNED